VPAFCPQDGRKPLPVSNGAQRTYVQVRPGSTVYPQVRLEAVNSVRLTGQLVHCIAMTCEDVR
jgi:hypothetical protein